MSIRWKQLVVALSVWALVVPGTVFASSLKVVFLSPDTSDFWQRVSGFMEAVAEDLDIDLSVVVDHSRNRYSYRELLSQVLSAPDKPDFVLFMCKESVTLDMIRMASEAGVGIFTFNTQVPISVRDRLRMPRERYPNWIGHVSPDDRSAGYDLARLLSRAAYQNLGADSPEQIRLVALSGSRDSSAAFDRNRGLHDASFETEWRVQQLVFAQWSRAEARNRMVGLLERYPKTNVVWAASSGMALGALEAVRNVGKRPGTEIVVGGVDWEPEALSAVRKGELAVAMGRHFMGGGLALLLVHDYAHGYDFDGDGYPLSYRLAAATPETIDTVEKLIRPKTWARFDFRQLSRVHNPAMARETVDAETLMDQLTHGLAELAAD